MIDNDFRELVTEEQIKEFVERKNIKKNGRPTKRPPIEVLAYLSDVRGLQTAEVAKIIGVQPSTIRAWRHLARKGEY